MSGESSRFAERARIAKARFIRDLQDARTAQHRLLMQFVEVNRDTEFGRAHGFAEIRTLDDYRRNVPIQTFADLAPWFERVYAGEQRVLTTAAAALFLSTTGTTGTPKVFPVTAQYFSNSMATLLVYWGSLLEYYPSLLERDDTMVMLYMAPKPFSEFSPTGVPIHNPTCLPAGDRNPFPYSRAPWYPPPSELSDTERLYFLARVAAESDVRGMTCLHPSRLQALGLLLAEQGARIVDDVRAGTIAGVAARTPNPDRARELGALLDQAPLTPRALWPKLEVISCWTGGSFQLYLPDILASYGGEIFAQPSSSSEASHITLPINRGSGDGPLAVTTNVYEFVPVVGGLRVEGPTLTFEDLEVGGTYEIVLTTCTGFYRYMNGDVFRVIGTSYGVPHLEFVGRGGVSDMTGEKITEQHVIAATQAALGSLGLETRTTTCCAVWGRPSRYELVFEPREPWPPSIASELADALDAELRQQNSRYALKRGFGDLAPATVRIVPAGTFAKYRAHLIARGLPANQLKDKVLHTDRAFLDLLDELA